MVPPSSSLLRDRDFLIRLGVTLAVLAVYRLGCWIPLPGVEPEVLMPGFSPAMMSAAMERISVLSLGVTPLLSVLLVIELAMIVWPPLRAWTARSSSNTSSLDGWIVLATLAFAAFQANGIAVAMESIKALVPTPGLLFRAGIIATLVAGTAILVWMAALVTRRGLGSGVLLLLAAPVLMALPSLFATQFVAEGLVSELDIVCAAFILALCIAGLVAAGLAQPSLVGNGQLFWPPLLAYTAPAWLLLIPLVLGDREAFEALVEAFKIGQPVRVLLLPLLTLVFYFWRARSLAAAGETTPAGYTVWVAPALIAAVVAAAELVMTLLPAPLGLDGRSVAILVACALSLLTAVRPIQKSPAEGGP
jgi:preprotein translocase subunit SecY